MRGNELLNKLENIDPAYIEAAGQASGKKMNTWVTYNKSNKRNSSFDERKNKFKWKNVVATAAFFALIIVSSAFLFALIKRDLPIDRFFPVDYSVGVADWYSPRTLSADLLMLKTKRPDIQTVSFSVRQSEKNVTEELPGWIYGADTLNEKYLRLYAYDDQASKAGFGGYLIYDIENARMIDLTSLIYGYFKNEICEEERENEPTRVIINIQFGDFGDNCVFDYLHTEYAPDETGETMIPVDSNKRYLIDIGTGRYTELPMRDVLTVSKSGEWVVNCGDKNNEYATYLFNTVSNKETEIPVSYRGYTVFGNDNKTIIFYAPQTIAKEDSSWDTTTAHWKIYDVDSGIMNDGIGRIVRFVEEGEAIVVHDNSGGKVFRIEDMCDITDEYALKIYEKYEIEKRLDNGVYSFFAVPLFGGDEILIADNVEIWTEWSDYYYIRQYDSDNIIVYSAHDNKAFKYDISALDIPQNYDGISIYVTDNGQKCRIVTYVDAGRASF